MYKVNIQQDLWHKCSCACAYLCTAGVEGLLLPGDAVLHHLLADQAQPLLHLLQLGAHLLR